MAGMPDMVVNLSLDATEFRSELRKVQREIGRTRPTWLAAYAVVLTTLNTAFVVYTVFRR